MENTQQEVKQQTEPPATSPKIHHPKKLEESSRTQEETPGIFSWARNLKIPQPSATGPQDSPTGKSTFSRLTSSLSLRLSPKGAQTEESTAEGTSSGAPNGGVLGTLTKGIVDTSKNAVKAVQVKARHMVSQNKRRYQVTCDFCFPSCTIEVLLEFEPKLLILSIRAVLPPFVDCKLVLPLFVVCS
jgi:hypothetical protein